MTTNADTTNGGPRQQLPDCPEVAFFIAAIVQRLGGSLMNDNGKRCVVRPEALSLLYPEGRPQMPGAEPWEQFHTDEEWRGAMKMAMYWLTMISPKDKDLVWQLFAPVSVDPRKPFDFRDLLQ